MKFYYAVTEKGDQMRKAAEYYSLKKVGAGFEGSYKDGRIRIDCASGHLLKLKTPDQINTDLAWSDPPTSYMPIPRDYELITGDEGDGRVNGMLGTIQRYIHKADCFIIATDSDREGEAIGHNIIQHFNYRGEVKRAWLAAGLDRKSLTDAFNNLRDANETKAYWRSSEARSVTDRLYTFLTRSYTFYAKYGKFGNTLGQGKGKAGTMSVGRLQTVIVAMIVDREEEIKNFVAKDYFTIRADFEFKGVTIEGEYSPVVTEDIIASRPDGVEWEPQKPKGDNIPLDKPLFVDKKNVNQFIQLLRDNADSAFIKNAATTTEKQSPPKTFELTEAQVVIGKQIGIGSDLVQTILEDLYEQGYLSYARTSKAELPRNLYADSERNAMFNSISQLHQLQSEALWAQNIHNGKDSKYSQFMPSVFSDKDMEHYGIVPTHQVMTPSAFAGIQPKKRENGKILHTADQMREAYLIVCKQFITTMMPPATYNVQRLSMAVPATDLLGHSEAVFNATAKQITDEGWKAIFNNNKSTGEKEFPELAVSDKGKFIDGKTKQQRTKPPVRYTYTKMPKDLANIAKEIRDPALRKRMAQSEGIGRPATRKSALQTILARNYIEKKGDVLYPMAKGIELVKYVPKWLKSPVTSAQLEDYLTKIAASKDDAKSCEMRDYFIELQTEKIEKLIQHMIDRFQQDLGERVKQAPKEVSIKMKKLIKSIAAKKGIEIPRGTLSDPLKASAFISDNFEKRKEGETYPPSDAQVALMKGIVGNMPSDITYSDEIFKDGQKAKVFIDKHIKYAPPSPKQLSLVRSLLAKLPAGESPPADVELYREAASNFIEAQFSKGGRGNANGGKSKGSSTRRRSGTRKPAQQAN